MRKPAVVRREYDELWDRVWWNRHQKEKHCSGAEAARRIEAMYGKANLEYVDAYDEIMVMTKFRTLGWVLGMEWEEAADT